MGYDNCIVFILSPYFSMLVICSLTTFESWRRWCLACAVLRAGTCLTCGCGALIYSIFSQPRLPYIHEASEALPSNVCTFAKSQQACRGLRGALGTAGDGGLLAGTVCLQHDWCSKGRWSDSGAPGPHLAQLDLLSICIHPRPCATVPRSRASLLKSDGKRGLQKVYHSGLQARVARSAKITAIIRPLPSPFPHSEVLLVRLFVPASFQSTNSFFSLWLLYNLRMFKRPKSQITNFFSLRWASCFSQFTILLRIIIPLRFPNSAAIPYLRYSPSAIYIGKI